MEDKSAMKKILDALHFSRLALNELTKEDSALSPLTEQAYRSINEALGEEPVSEPQKKTAEQNLSEFIARVDMAAGGSGFAAPEVVIEKVYVMAAALLRITDETNARTAAQGAEVERLTRERDEAVQTAARIASERACEMIRAEKAEAELLRTQAVLRAAHEVGCVRSDHKHYDTARAHAEALAGALRHVRRNLSDRPWALIDTIDAALTAYHATTEAGSKGCTCGHTCPPLGSGEECVHAPDCALIATTETKAEVEPPTISHDDYLVRAREIAAEVRTWPEWKKAGFRSALINTTSTVDTKPPTSVVTDSGKEKGTKDTKQDQDELRAWARNSSAPKRVRDLIVHFLDEMEAAREAGCARSDHNQAYIDRITGERKELIGAMEAVEPVIETLAADRGFGGYLLTGEQTTVAEQRWEVATVRFRRALAAVRVVPAAPTSRALALPTCVCVKRSARRTPENGPDECADCDGVIVPETKEG